MRHVVLMTALAVVITLTGCADTRPLDPPAGQKAKITSESMDFFKNSYLPQIGSTHPGAFAVSLSGLHSAYSYCQDIMCKSGGSYAQDAIKLCERDGEQCYLFAADREIRVAYDVVE